jgi:galactose mutarotase-like enzyme
VIEPSRHETPVEGSTVAPTVAHFNDAAIIWDELQSRSLTWGVPGQPSLEITFPDTPMLGLWQIPGARYLCIEPWAGRADPVGYAGDFTDKPGVMLLDAGAERAFRMDVRLKES